MGGLGRPSGATTAQHATLKLHQPPHNLVLFFEHVAENADFYRVMLGKWQVTSFVERLRDYLKVVMEQRYQQMLAPQHHPPVSPELVMRSLVASFIEMIRWWVEKHQPCSAAQMAQHYVLMSVFDLYHALGMEQPDPPA